jgi:hypothetical protein
MRIVNRKTFMAMPVGTVFSQFEPNHFGDLEVFVGALSSCNDFLSARLTCEVDSSGSEENDRLLHNAVENGASFNLDFDTASRDGCFNDSQLFAVWERKDVEGLIERLQTALVDGYKLAEVAP